MKVVLISGKAMSGKDTAASILKEIMEQDGKKVLTVHYADLLKYICKSFFGWNGEKDDIGRNLLQKIGTNVIREQQPNYWVDFIESILLLFPNEWDFILIPDTRFPNEIIDMNNLFDTFSIRINRTDFESSLTDEQKQHISETALDNFKFDYYIDTISDLDYLRNKLVKMYEYMKCINTERK